MAGHDIPYTLVYDAAELVALSAWQQSQIDDAVASYRRHMKPAKPMVAVRNMSPAFLEMAIQLDVLLAEYRDKYGRWHLLMRRCERNGLPQEQRHRSGQKVPVPELQRIMNLAREAQDAVGRMIRTIESTKAVRYGDRVLKKKATDLRCCNWFRQLDWLYVLYDQDQVERRQPHPLTTGLQNNGRM